MRVLLCVHHRLDPDLGAPGVTLALGRALELAGCSVDYLSFDDFFGGSEGDGVRHQVAFPWRVAAHLRRRAAGFDVIDSSAGDTWLWASLGRPGASDGLGLVVRSHGLEMLAHAERLRAAARGELELSRRYRIYHGGLRLAEVRRSLRSSDHCVVLNGREREQLERDLRVPPERISVIQYAIGEHFHRLQPPLPAAGPLRLAFVGSWIERKGPHALVSAASALAARGVDFRLTLLGADEETAAAFPANVRERLTITPSFPNERLPALLEGQEILLQPSLFEGSSGALLEGMACGLTPVVSTVGAAPDIVRDGENGVLVEPGNGDALADAVASLGAVRDRLLAMRGAAQETAGEFRWERVAKRTLEAYELARAMRCPSARATR